MTRRVDPSVREARREHLLASLTAWLQDNGISNEQTAWELAQDMWPIMERLIDANRDVVTR